MVFCSKCGTQAPEGSAYCPKCGAQLTTAPAAVASAGKKAQWELGGILILVGGILATLGSLWVIPMMVFFGAGFPGFGGGMMGGFGGMLGGSGGLIAGMMLAGAAVGLIGGVLAVYVWTRMKMGNVKNLGAFAIVLGAVMLMTTHFLSGILVLIGGILSYTSQ